MRVRHLRDLPFLGAVIGPSAFRMLSGAESLVADATDLYLVCRVCGVRPFSQGTIEQLGGDVIAINLNSLDAPDLASAMPRRRSTPLCSFDVRRQGRDL